MNKKWECYEIEEAQVNSLIEKYKLNSILA